MATKMIMSESKMKLKQIIQIKWCGSKCLLLSADRIRDRVVRRASCAWSSQWRGAGDADARSQGMGGKGWKIFWEVGFAMLILSEFLCTNFLLLLEKQFPFPSFPRKKGVNSVVKSLSVTLFANRACPWHSLHCPWLSFSTSLASSYQHSWDHVQVCMKL